MNIPIWLHPIVRRIFSGLVNDAWTKAGRPILAENARVVKPRAVVVRDGWIRIACDTDELMDLKPGIEMRLIIIEEVNDGVPGREHQDGQGLPQDQDEEEVVEVAGEDTGAVEGSGRDPGTRPEDGHGRGGQDDRPAPSTGQADMQARSVEEEK